MGHLDLVNLRSPNVRKNLVGLWIPGLGPTGTVLRNSSNSRHHGTIVGTNPGTVWRPSDGRYALLLNGTDNYINTDFSGVFVAEGGFTFGNYSIGAWVNTTASGTLRTVYIEGNTGTTAQHIELRIGTANVAQVFVRSNESSSVTLTASGAAINDGLWHFIMLTRAGATTSLYCDGVLVATNGSYPATNYTINTASIGVNRRTTNSNFFNGLIGTVCTYNRALTEKEVRLISSDQGIFDEPNSRRRLAVVSGGSGSTVTPDPITLTTTSFAPTASTPILATPTTLSLSLTTFAPVVTAPQTVTPTTNALTLSGFAPTITVGNAQTPTPSTVALSLTTFAPTVSTPRLVTPTTVALETTAIAPTVTASESGTVTPPTLALTLTLFAPVVVNPHVCTPTTMSLVTTKFAPTISTPKVVTPSTVALTTSRFSPVVATPQTVTPSTAALVSTKYVPTVTASGGGGTTTGRDRSLLMEFGLLV